MAIGPEQLDIKKLAKLFLLKSELGRALTKEDLREILLTFSEDDFDGIRDAIYPSSAEKKALRAMIAEATEFLESMTVGTREGNYPQTSYDILEEAINLADAIARTTYDGDGLEGVQGRQILADTTAALMNIKERTYGSIRCEEGQYDVMNDLWYGPHNYYGSGTWKPVKRLYGSALANGDNDQTIPYYITLEESLPSNLFAENTNIIRGLFLHDEAANKDVIITRQSTVGGKSITALGGRFNDIIFINGVIINDILYCANEDVRYASLAASYLERPINPAPCTFFAENAGIRYEARFAPMFANISSEGKLTEEAKVLFNVISANLAVGQSDIESTNAITPSRGVLTAIPNMVDGRHIYVDNLHKVITGVGKMETVDEVSRLIPGSANSILYCSNGATVTISPEYDGGGACVKVDVQIVSADGESVSDVYKVAFEEVLIDQQADIVDGNKYIGKYHPVDKSYTWIPAALVANKYYISPEPIDSELRLYKDNKDIIQIVGILANNSIYSRHENIVSLYPELFSAIGQYRLTYVNCGYYDGFVFSGNEKNRDNLADYLEYMDVFRKVNQTTGELGGNKGKLGFIMSEFIEITYNGAGTGTYYWRGEEDNIVRLPDTRKECETYLNIVSFKTLPSSSSSN